MIMRRLQQTHSLVLSFDYPVENFSNAALFIQIVCEDLFLRRLISLTDIFRTNISSRDFPVKWYRL